MIEYDNSQQIGILFRREGSIILDTFPISALVGLFGFILALIRYFDKTEEWLYGRRPSLGSPEDKVDAEGMYITDPLAASVVVTVVGYLLVVRTNMALSRWMDAIGDVETMLAKWTSAFQNLSGFFAGKEDSPEVLERILMFRIRTAHWFSLMAALAFASLRGGHIDNLEELAIKVIFPPKNSHQSKQSGSGEERKTYFANRKESEAPDGSVSHGLSSNWSSDIASGTNSRASENNDGVGSMDVMMSRKMYRLTCNEEEGEDACQLRKTEELRSMQLDVLSMPTEEEIQILEHTEDKVNIICLWIIQGIVREMRAQTLDTPPPIVTRVLQELSNGMLGYNQALKVSMTPFPFPFAQMVSWLLLVLDISIPFFMDNFTQNIILTPLLSFFLPMCYHGLNQTSVELEEPFGVDWNDVDIEDRNKHFHKILIDTLRLPSRPPAYDPGGYSELEPRIRKFLCNGMDCMIDEDNEHLSWDILTLPTQRPPTNGSDDFWGADVGDVQIDTFSDGTPCGKQDEESDMPASAEDYGEAERESTKSKGDNCWEDSIQEEACRAQLIYRSRPQGKDVPCCPGGEGDAIQVTTLSRPRDEDLSDMNFSIGNTTL